MSTKPDDLEAVRIIVTALEPFDSSDQERILRWSREKLGLSSKDVHVASTTHTPTATPLSESTIIPTRSHGSVTNIKSFIAEKAPSSDNQFAAAVAYYYRFEAPEAARKEAITADDLQEACRLAGRTRVAKPAQTLINAHNGGLLDKAAERGSYAISTVGENLVAMALPSSGGAKPRGAQKSTAKSAKKTSPANKSGKAPKK
jgi:hypothetical protein